MASRLPVPKMKYSVALLPRGTGRCRTVLKPRVIREAPTAKMNSTAT